MLNLDGAIAAHANWKAALVDAVDRKESIDVTAIARDDQCDLGKWLRGSGEAEAAGSRAFYVCRQRHMEFHSVAGKVAEAIRAGQFEVAAALLASDRAYSKASTMVVAAIIELKRELALRG